VEFKISLTGVLNNMGKKKKIKKKIDSKFIALLDKYFNVQYCPQCKDKMLRVGEGYCCNKCRIAGKIVKE